MPRAHANGIELEYDQHGHPADPPMLLIMGLSAQMTTWRDPFVKELAARGFRVIRFDNRDIGLSTWFDQAGVPDLAQALQTGDVPPPAYTLDDMADDAAGLLDALGIGAAHIVGASMGGMIAQTFAIRYRTRTLSLCSIMSTTGDPAVGQPDPSVLGALFLSEPPSTPEEAEEAALVGSRLIGSPGYPADEAEVRANGRAAFERSNHPAGVPRQTLAVLHQPDRTADLAALDVPTLVIHGDADPLVAPSGGIATAGAVPGAELWMQPGVGHDLPPALYAETADRIAANCRRAALGVR
jgi:pimeloyl-ACP methyl ester carboxylesterase